MIRAITSILRLFVAAIWTIVFIAICIVVLFTTFHPTWVLKLVRKMWAPLILFVFGVKVNVEGLENIKEGKSYIYISNHASYLDIPILLKAIPHNFYFIAKRELIKIPFFGWMMWLLGMIFIDRKNKRRAVRSMKIAAIKLKRGKCVLVFPEGTFNGHTEMLPFKKGSFHIAVRANIPVLPIGMVGAEKIWPDGSLLKMKAGNVHVAFGVPFSRLVDDDLKAIGNLTKRAEEEVKALIKSIQN